MVQAFMFTTTPEPYPDQPNVIVPFTNDVTDPTVHKAMRLNLQMQGIEPRMARLNDTLDAEYAYDRLVRTLWREGRPFILVEHDILPWPGALAQMWSCPEPWCGFPYFVHGTLRSYLGCTKFDPAAIGAIPLPEEPVLWSELDLTIIRALSAREFTGHLHSPAVIHLKYWHQRMTTPTLVLPEWMT